MWFKVDDGFYDHPKVARLKGYGPKGFEAIAMWLMLGCWCSKYLTDGRFHKHLPDVVTYGRSRRILPLLIECGFIRQCTDDPDFFEFCDWLDYQPSRSYVLASRQRNALRVNHYRKTEIKTKLLEQQSSKCAVCGCVLSISTATIDHVVEVSDGGTSEMDNLRISCTSCNSKRTTRRKMRAAVIDYSLHSADGVKMPRPDPTRPNLKELKLTCPPNPPTEDKPILTLVETVTDPERKDVSEVFEYWAKVFHKRAGTKLTPARKSKIKARLKEGFSCSDLQNAILSASQSAFHIENGHTDIETILRGQKQVEMHLERLNKTLNSTEQKAYYAQKLREEFG